MENGFFWSLFEGYLLVCIMKKVSVKSYNQMICNKPSLIITGKVNLTSSRCWMRIGRDKRDVSKCQER